MTIVPIKRALISVSDKTGIVDFAGKLTLEGIEILSTGGTSRCLQDAGIAHKLVEDVTHFPEMLDGRVKTLHPSIHGGILGDRDKHHQEMTKHHITPIDLVVVNFYPFSKVVEQKNTGWDQAIELIDIGGPTMVRAAAKNFFWVGVVTNPQDYAEIIQQIQQQKGLALETRKKLAEKAFALTSSYDDMIHRYFLNQQPSDDLQLHLKKHSTLRYGENPHQQAHAYQDVAQSSVGVLAAKQHQGKMLSYNNLLDADAAFICLKEFAEPACVIVKHANPCGVALAPTIESAFSQAFAADSSSAFGGIVALNRPCTKALAEKMNTVFIEVVLAPAYDQEALALFAQKPNLRVLEMPSHTLPQWEMRCITGALLMQERDTQIITTNDLQLVTTVKPSQQALATMLFAWRIVKHIKSNAILIAKDNVTLGIGAGQVSRIDAVEIAIRKAQDKTQDAVLASDAFFPFRDSIDRIAQTGIRAIIQPGGSIRDEEVIAACNEQGIAMVFTGKRCFKH